MSERDSTTLVEVPVGSKMEDEMNEKSKYIGLTTMLRAVSNHCLSLVITSVVDERTSGMIKKLF